MDLAQNRESLKEQINRLQASLKLPYAEEQWGPVVRQMHHLRERLERSYLSRPRWWVRKAWRSIRSVYSHFRPCDLSDLLRNAKSVEPLGPSALTLSLARKVDESTLDRIELTAANIANWLEDETCRTPGFDAARCFQTLNTSLYPGYGHVGGGPARCSFFLEAADRDRILISGIVRWPAVSAQTG